MKSTILIGTDFGKASEVLQFYTQELPALTPGFARIQVKSAGINPIDARRMTGEFRHSALPQTFGTEFAGVILEINGSSNFKIGDEVLGSGAGFTHATVIDVPLTNLILKPENMSWQTAGSVAGVAQTAMTILDELGDIKSLLIHGASGGVGSITIQLAKEKGIEVVATGSEKNQDYLKSLGAIPVVYGHGLVEQINAVFSGEFDASVDMAGTEEATQTSLATVNPNGKMATIAGRPVSSSKIQNIWVKRDPKNLKYVVDGIAQGKFTWEIDATYKFDDAIKAYEKILQGHNRGKLVLEF
ncbi:NADP-dependent oxidoreductase [Sphingobacterium bovistauri]|uniref:NADP-dependent oxidoreductase n=1 Tax=Sphingobacterium bovistauri TaxID=2781959 RepID=A0ABS7Z0F7_9SPHI|nr:NADP-dependent oxidoreductase [Sphingobacterium bovistauri]MCA5003650.1 NADP-dependent oxidoreductase [Sphingobacterium bovistauri]